MTISGPFHSLSDADKLPCPTSCTKVSACGRPPGVRTGHGKPRGGPVSTALIAAAGWGQVVFALHHLGSHLRGGGRLTRTG